MRSKLVRWQLVAFLVITILGITFTGVRYVGLDKYLWSSGYSVQMELQNSGGIFENAEVTYRGVAIGTVGPLTLTDRGVSVELLINDNTPDIPTDLKAVVANRSAVGEQYVDLQPNTNEGPFLSSGSVIPMDRTAVPVTTEKLLSSVDQLVRSVPVESLRTVVSELGTAFNGLGPSLQRLLDQGNLLTTTAIDNQPQTLRLISDAQTVLDTQRSEGSSIIGFSRDLQLVTQQLQASDPDLRRLITTGQSAGSEVGALLDSSSASLANTVANLGTVTTVTSARTDGLRAINQLLPAVAAAGFTSAPGDGFAHFGLVLNVNDPFPCTAGYEGTYQELERQRAANPAFNDYYDKAPLNTNAYCAEPNGSPISVRGTQHAVAQPGSPVLPPVQSGGAGYNSGALSQDSGVLVNQLSGLLNRLIFGS
ncbi:MlaD family protein [Rhodococcus sp. X156]|uniref:MCE family protein n=1 Tax=Rhodococcus sp. X156 TaxID=2499145 RepID=UPI000FD97DFC|nr:MlaD family protein [Rhodococcus sp. X156]